MPATRSPLLRVSDTMTASATTAWSLRRRDKMLSRGWQACLCQDSVGSIVRLATMPSAGCFGLCSYVWELCLRQDSFGFVRERIASSSCRLFRMNLHVILYVCCVCVCTVLQQFVPGTWVYFRRDVVVSCVGTALFCIWYLFFVFGNA